MVSFRKEDGHAPRGFQTIFMGGVHTMYDTWHYNRRYRVQGGTQGEQRPHTSRPPRPPITATRRTPSQCVQTYGAVAPPGGRETGERENKDLLYFLKLQDATWELVVVVRSLRKEAWLRERLVAGC